MKFIHFSARCVRRAIAMKFVRLSVRLSVCLSVCLSVTGVLCDHTVQLKLGFKFMVGQSDVLGTLTPKHVRPPNCPA